MDKTNVAPVPLVQVPNLTINVECDCDDNRFCLCPWIRNELRRMTTSTRNLIKKSNDVKEKKDV
jgi:hypothetical protein